VILLLFWFTAGFFFPDYWLVLIRIVASGHSTPVLIRF